MYEPPLTIQKLVAKRNSDETRRFASYVRYVYCIGVLKSYSRDSSAVKNAGKKKMSGTVRKKKEKVLDRFLGKGQSIPCEIRVDNNH